MKVFLLQGGIIAIDGVVTSAGMNELAHTLDALPGVDIDTYLWNHWTQVYHDVMAHQDDKVVVIGYSGGGMKATWVANGCVLGNDGAIHGYRRPRIDLMITYDPSPAESMQALHDNVTQAVNYHNTMPLMFGLGGGVVTGPHVTTIDIAEQHLAVQFNPHLHARTVAYVQALLSAKTEKVTA